MSAVVVGVRLFPFGDKTESSFTVQAMNGELCSIDFDYRIVAKRLGYEDVRMEQVIFETNEDDNDQK